MREHFYLPPLLRCPVCGETVETDGTSVFCTGERRHTYDIAREGYVNLLPPGRAKNSRTGDSAEMIRAREEFLAGGAYDRYSREAARFAAGFMEIPEGELVLIDAGCGEGRHTVNMAKELSEITGKTTVAAGFDASKFGARAAAKRYLREKLGGILPFFAAGNIYSLPVAHTSCDIFTSLFAPLPEDEARRTVKPGGILMICAADPGHLSELRSVLYESPIPSGGGADIPEGFSPVGERVIEYEVALSTAEEIMALFTMTPFYHNAPAEGREKLTKMNSLTVTVRVICRVGRRI